MFLPRVVSPEYSESKKFNLTLIKACYKCSHEKIRKSHSYIVYSKHTSKETSRKLSTNLN